MLAYNLKKRLEVWIDASRYYNDLQRLEHERYPKIADAIPGQNQELPESTEITLQAQWLLKNLLFDMITVCGCCCQYAFHTN
jgi:hypothetical protein